MLLLTFAHRAEAGRFLKSDKYRSCDFEFADLYKSKNNYLLITGEGIQKTTERLSAVCVTLYKEIKAVINLGIAGAIDNSVKVGKVYPVRVCYLSRFGSMNFHSFYTSNIDDQNAQDCVSLDYRATYSNLSAHLKEFASLVDREVWAIGSVCSLFNLPFASFKLATDRIGQETSNPFNPDRQQTEQYSELLYKFFIESECIEVKQTIDPLQYLGEEFYFTTSQSRRYRSLMKHLSIKFGNESEVFKRVDLATIRSFPVTPKERTAYLLQKLSDHLNPINVRIRERLTSLTKGLTNAGCQVQFSRDYRDDEINLSVRITKRDQLQQLRDALMKLPYDEILAILNGNIDV